MFTWALAVGRGIFGVRPRLALDPARGRLWTSLLSAQQDQKVTLIGPVAADTSWQARDEHAFDKTQFAINWQAQQVTCPEGKTSRYWTPTYDRHGKEVIHIKFHPKDCQVCPTVTPN